MTREVIEVPKSEPVKCWAQERRGDLKCALTQLSGVVVTTKEIVLGLSMR